MSLPRLSKSLLSAACGWLIVATVHAEPSEFSAGSQRVIATLINAPEVSLDVGQELTLLSIEAGEGGFRWLLRRAHDGTEFSLMVGSEGSRWAATALKETVTKTIDVVAMTGGVALVISGEVLAFVPDALGQALLHHERLTQ